MKQETIGDSGISWTICKTFAPRFRWITMPASQPTAWKHWRHIYTKYAQK